MFKSRSGRIFIIVVVHTQCSKLVKGMEYIQCCLWYYKEPLVLFKIRVGHSPGFGLPSVAILPLLCRKRRNALFTINLGITFHMINYQSNLYIDCRLILARLYLGLY